MYDGFFCWNYLGSLELVPSNTLLTTFNIRSFCPHGIMPSFDRELVGKMVSVEVEVVDSHLDYNLLLGRSWTYAMCVIPSSIFRSLIFLHEGKIVTISDY